MDKKRPLGITILGWFYIATGTLTFFWLILRAALGALYKSMPGSMYVSNILLALVGIWIAWYLLKLYKRARKWIIYFMIFEFGRGILYLPFSLKFIQNNFSGSELSLNLWALIIGICFEAAFVIFFVYYLTRPKIKEAFK